jgi:hypothetical protein
MLKLDRKRHELQHSGVLQWGAVGRKSYPTVRSGAPAKLKYLHSKIARRVDLARVMYGTMQSERRRMCKEVASAQARLQLAIGLGAIYQPLH